MRIQIIQDSEGHNAGVFIPIGDWEKIIHEHQDLQALYDIELKPKQKLSALAGTLSKETADDMLKYIEQSRNEWDGRLGEQK
ncbi:MAG: hypothetical protein U0Y96_04610 [Candidatus Kapaibacterium sp.]